MDLKREGLTCILISHKLNEVLRVADAITVMRDGKSIRTYNTATEQVTRSMLIKDMVGREMTNLYPPKNAQIGEVVMEVKDWTVYHPEYHDMKVVDAASFTVRKGEIVGFCGPMGAGRTELMMSLFGRSYGSRSEGTVLVRGREVSYHTPREAISAGVGYVSRRSQEPGLGSDSGRKDQHQQLQPRQTVACGRGGLVS